MEPVMICRKYSKICRPGALSRNHPNHCKINCVKIARKRAGSQFKEQTSRIIRDEPSEKSFVHERSKKRTPAENLIKFKVGEKFLKIRFREKVGWFKIVYKVFKKIFKVDCSNLSSRFFIAF